MRLVAVQNPKGMVALAELQSQEAEIAAYRLQVSGHVCAAGQLDLAPLDGLNKCLEAAQVPVSLLIGLGVLFKDGQIVMEELRRSFRLQSGGVAYRRHPYRLLGHLATELVLFPRILGRIGHSHNRPHRYYCQYSRCSLIHC